LTEEQRLEAAREVYERVVVPAAERLRERGAPLLPHEAVAGDSFWEPRPERPLVRAAAADELGPGLREQWTALGLEELLPVADAVAELATRLRRTGETAEDVSPYIYAMF
jgi:hypothetical protein